MASSDFDAGAYLLVRLKLLFPAGLILIDYPKIGKY